MHRTRNAAYGQPYRGFESLPLRHELTILYGRYFRLLMRTNFCAHSGSFSTWANHYRLRRDDSVGDRSWWQRHVSSASSWWYGRLSRQCGNSGKRARLETRDRGTQHLIPEPLLAKGGVLA